MKKQQPLFLKSLNTLEVEELLRADTPLFLPIGTLEAHGRHLPVGTDTLCAEKIAERLSIGMHGVVAPAFEYGLTNVLAQTSPGSFFPEDLYEAFIERVIDNFRVQGFKTIIVVNGHGGNREALKKVIRKLSRTRPAGLAVVNWWLLADHFVEQVYDCKPGGHAAVEETAAMLDFFPELVEAGNYQPETDDYVVDDGIWLFPPPGEVLIDQPGQGRPDFSPGKARQFTDLFLKDIQQRLERWRSAFGRIKGGLRP